MVKSKSKKGSGLAKPVKKSSTMFKKKSKEAVEDTSSSVALIDPSSFSLTRVGINYMAPGASFAAWAEFGQKIRMVRDGLQWVAGDWLNLGKERFDEQHSQELDVDQWTPETLSNYANICLAFLFPRRRGQLSFGHHAVVYKLSIENQDKLLDAAIANGWSEKELRKEAQKLKSKKTGVKAHERKLPNGDDKTEAIRITFQHGTRNDVETAVNDLKARGVIDDWDSCE